jgi:hypothetical protein
MSLTHTGIGATDKTLSTRHRSLLLAPTPSRGFGLAALAPVEIPGRVGVRIQQD